MTKEVLCGGLVAALLVGALAALEWRRYLDLDFIQYWLAGVSVLRGVDPYDSATWRALHDEVGSDFHEPAYVSPLTTAVATLPFAFLPPPLAVAAWFFAQTALALGGLVALGRRLFVARPRADLALLLLIAVVLQPAYVTGGGGNLVRHLLGVTAGGIALLASGGAFAGGLVLGFVVLKPHLFLVFVPALALLVRDRPRFVGGLGLVAAALLAVSLVARADWIGEWLAHVGQLQGVVGRTNLWGVLPAQADAIVAITLLVAFGVWWRLRAPEVALVAAAALALSLFLAPYAAPYDQSLLIVVAAVLLAMTTGLRRVAFLTAFLAGCAVVPWLSLAGLLSPELEPLHALPPLVAFGLLVAADLTRTVTEFAFDPSPP